MESSLPRKIKVTSVEELLEETRWWRLFIGTTSIQIELSGVNKEQLRFWQSTIDYYMGDCGCREGHIGLGFALILIALLMLIEPSLMSTNGWASTLGAGIGIIGAFIGKVIGVFRARILVRKSIQELSRSLQAERLVSNDGRDFGSTT